MNRLKAFGLALVAGVTLLAAIPKAAADPQSFGGTNYLSNGVGYTTYPTNQPGIATGNDIDVRNYKVTGFYLTGTLVNTNPSAVIGVQMVRSANAANAATVTNWETTPLPSGKILIPLGAQTNTFTFITNLVEDVSNPADSIGVYSLTNSLTGGCYLTNVDFGLIKKIIPIKYP